MIQLRAPFRRVVVFLVVKPAGKLRLRWDVIGGSPTFIWALAVQCPHILRRGEVGPHGESPMVQWDSDAPGHGTPLSEGVASVQQIRQPLSGFVAEQGEVLTGVEWLEADLRGLFT